MACLNVLHYTDSSSNYSYFWQYNSQCKGPKVPRLLDLASMVDTSTQYQQVMQPSDYAVFQGSSPQTYGAWQTNYHTATSLAPDVQFPWSSAYRFPKYCPIWVHSLPGYPLVEFEDPVQRYYDFVHCMKLRRGDGNDVTPNPLRLQAMGAEMDRLTQLLSQQGDLIIAGCQTSANSEQFGEHLDIQNTNVPVDDHPSTTFVSTTGLIPVFFNEKNELEVCSSSTLLPFQGQMLTEPAKKEKNKLSSRICRLKKKAFHEANKIKYTALGLEYKELAIVIQNIRRIIIAHLQSGMYSTGVAANQMTTFLTSTHMQDQGYEQSANNEDKAYTEESIWGGRTDQARFASVTDGQSEIEELLESLSSPPDFLYARPQPEPPGTDSRVVEIQKYPHEMSSKVDRCHGISKEFGGLANQFCLTRQAEYVYASTHGMSIALTHEADKWMVNTSLKCRVMFTKIVRESLAESFDKRTP